jgi:hypothetical protein
LGETAKAAKPISGDKLYQRRAREALPLLVRQAQAQSPISYSDLARELGMPNPRNLNYPLGSIGQALQSLSSEWEEDIPPIQCLVINKQTGLPGEGVWWFRWKDDFYKLPPRKQRDLVRAELQEIFRYRKWPVVLKALGLSVDYTTILLQAAKPRRGGECERHRKLKEYIAEHPEVLQLHLAAGVGTIEFPLPSGDSLDVLFRIGDDWIAIEAKSAVSDVQDIVRGMFQCVKYRAVIMAYQATQNLPQSARTILVIEGTFPAELDDMKQHMPGIEVKDRIRPQ